ncbi:MAG: hypothetical protein RSF68_08975 [Myroides sp.]
MLPNIFNRSNLIRFCLVTSSGLLLTACSGLNQKPYDVDGIYNNSKIVVEDTHEKGTYYQEYFKEKSEETDAYFTDVENYSSNYNEANGGWGDATSETQLVYHYDNWGWGNPYWGWNNWGWGMGFGYGFGFGWGGGWGYPYYGWGGGWGYPYYGGGWGWGYNGYRNISRSNSYRSLTSRQMAGANGNRMVANNTRSLRGSSLSSSRNLNATNRTFARANTSLNRISTSQGMMRNTRTTSFDDNRTIRNNRFNTNTRTNTNTRMERSTSRPTYTPSSNTRMNTGGSMGGSRGGGSMGGGMRSGGGGGRR